MAEIRKALNILLILPRRAAGVVAARARRLRRDRPELLFWLAVCTALAVAQVSIAGYAFGVGNQAIQVPMLQRAADPSLFAGDAMLSTTAGDYPSYFFTLLALPVRLFGVEGPYAVLHFLSALGTFAAMAALAHAIFRNRWATLLSMLMLVGGHHEALAGDSLYSTGFTHTFAVFPLAIWSMALAFRGRYAPAMLIAGVLFNLHALTAAYLVVLLLASWFGRFGLRGTIRSPVRLALPLVLFAVAAAPTVAQMVAHRQAFDEAWIRLTQIRSADHSFPSSWWQAGSATVPRFALLIGLFVLSLRFRAALPKHRQLLAMLLAAATLGVVGWVFADVWTSPTVLRAQLFRCSRLVMVLLMAQIAYAAIRSIAALWRGDPRSRNTSSSWRSSLETAWAVFAVAAIAIPALLPAMPLAFAFGCVVAVVNDRLSVRQAVLAGFVVFVSLAAAHDLGFPLFTVVGGQSSSVAHPTLAMIVLAVAAVVVATMLVRQARVRDITLMGLTGILLICAIPAYRGAPADAWTQTQQWAAANTKPEAVFLTPSQPGGFRVRSQRAVVGEWRDGTQLYFSAAFAPTWWARMADLQPGLLTDASGTDLLSAGRPLESLDDETLVAMANRYGASHIVLRNNGTRAMPLVYANDSFAVFLPQLPVVEAPVGTPDKDRWRDDERFMRETVLPNIEKHRKADAKLQLIDDAGRPVVNATVEVRQTRPAFGFSASLPFFVAPEGPATHRDHRPAPVQQPELDRFLDIFNFSMIPFSGKWMYVEPKEGERRYEDLDKYVEWCVAHGIRIEYHFVSGYSAPWLRTKSKEQQGEAFVRHATELATRYGDKIDAWQIVNERNLIDHSPKVFEALRKIVPNAQLGISDCAKFAPENASAKSKDLRQKDMYRGLTDIQWLKSQGVKPDFMGIHGHRPFGLWPEAKNMYDVFDTFAREDVRLHVTELSIPVGVPFLGNIRGGTVTAEQQAEFYTRFFTICYSHPSVDMVNIWGIGPDTWKEGGGLLNADYSPKPGFIALKKLITETWRTKASLRTGIDGVATFRGFQGDYEADVTLPSGKRTTVKFSVANGAKQALVRLRVEGDNVRVAATE